MGKELQFNTKTQLQDAQRNPIPTQGAKSVEISLHDLDGREVLLKQNATSSSKVNQPILCYGRLMEHGWGINSRERMQENGESFEMKMRTAWRRKYLKRWRKNQEAY